MVYELQRTNVDWEYTAERSRRHSIGSSNGVSIPRGLVLGGTGTINAMKYARGNSRDYDRWEQFGNVGWNWDNVLQYFKKSEDNRVNSIAKSAHGTMHGTGGYLSVDYNEVRDTMNTVLMKAAKEIGFKELSDLNGDEFVGYGRSQFTIFNGTRCSPAKAFLSPIKHRKNLHVIKHGFATSVSFTANNIAQGVNFMLRNRFSIKAMARKEVIVSAGAVNTPKLLMLSGIGRQADLAPFNIPQRVDLNVGANLQDHVAVPIFFKFKQSSKTTINLTLEKILNLFEFVMKNPRQSLATNDVSSVLIYSNTVNSTDMFPDVQFQHHQFSKGGVSSYLITRRLGYDQEIVESVHRAELEADIVMVQIVVLNPKSRGKIGIASNDPYVDPIVDTNYFSEYDDLKTLVRAIRVQQQMLQTESYRQNEAELHRLNIPACVFIQYDTDEYWECYIRHLSTTLSDLAGTAKMGPDGDPDAVVDSRLKVRQIGNLRVVDASIMPDIVSGSLNAPTIMIGEKGADIIKQDYGL